MPDSREFRDWGDRADPLVDALRSMPLSHPETDAWPQLAAQLAARSLQPRNRRRHLAWPIAMAAALLLALLLRPAMRDLPVDSAVDPSIAVKTGDETTRALIAQSQWMERLVQSEAMDPVAQDGDQLLLEQGLRDRIRSIDDALADSAATQQAALWQARIGALSQLAEVKWAARQSDWVQDGAGRLRPAASFVTWSN